jgi:Rrf2 family transcriptional regulator, nitric oxide-sensitive transcriptional repressor
MRLTSFTDYSLRVLIYLAAQPERRATIAEIARAFEISESHLTKVVHFLGKQGWLANTRGKGGGLGLGQVPSAIVLGTVVRQAEGGDLPAECFDIDHNHCTIARICKLRSALRRAVDAFYQELDRYTIEDLVHNRSALSKVLLIKDPGSRTESRTA